MNFLALKIKFARYQWAAFALLMLLQRSPALKVVSLFEKVLTQPLARIVQSTTWVATSMGVFHATAGATQFNTSPGRSPYTVSTGDEFQMTFTVTDAPKVPFRWEIRGKIAPGLTMTGDGGQSLEGPFEDPGDTHYKIEGKIITITGQPTDPGIYVMSAQAFNDVGDTDNKEYEIQVNVTAAAPDFVWHPRSMRVATGGRAQFFFEADSELNSIQWLKNGLPISGATEASLVLSDVETGDAGLYSVEISSSGGVSTSEQATLTIDDAATSNFVNLATRGRVGVDADILIPGFTVLGGSSKTVLFRGLGPELEQFGINDFLPDPQIELVQTIYENGLPVGQQVLFSNDNWEESPNAAELASVMQSTGKTLPAGSKDAALLVTLGEGVYTIKLSGVDGATGVGLAELFVIE